MLPAGIRRLFRLGRGAKDVAAGVDAELQFHLEAKIAALVEQGMLPQAAREEALRQFGDVRATRAALEAIDRREALAGARRDRLGGWWLDLRHAVRSLRRTPGVTAAVIVTLALGIGANAAMFDILDQLFLRPPPGVDRPGELHRLHVSALSYFTGRRMVATGFDMNLHDALSEQVSSIHALAGYSSGRRKLGRGQDGGEARVSFVTGTYFGLLGAEAQLGRLLAPDDDRAGAPPAAVVSSEYWRRRFAGLPSVLGATISLNDVTYTVVGVTREEFGGPDPDAVDVWVPVHVAGPAERGPSWRESRRGGVGLYLLARLVPGATAAAFEDEATAMVRRSEILARFYGDTALRALSGPIQLLRGPRTLSGGAVLSLAVGGVTLVVLLVAAANVAGLLSIRAAGRRRELAVRSALGAGRWRVGRLLVVESLVLAGVAGLTAGGVAVVTARVLRGMLLPTYQWVSGSLDWRVLAFAGLVTLAMGLGTGLAPAVQAARKAGVDDLRAGTRAARRWRTPLRYVLLVTQVALSLTLLVGASLFTRSLARARGLDLSFDVDHLAVVDVSNLDRQDTTAVPSDFVGALERRIRALPGVRDIAMSTSAMMYSWTMLQLRVPGVDSLPRTGGFYMSGVSPEFFAVTGIQLVRGRSFSANDDVGAPKVAVVNETMTELVWPGQDPLTKCIYVGSPALECRRVIGVVRTIRDRRPTEDLFLAGYYLPLPQVPGLRSSRALVVRTTGDPRRLSEPILQALRSTFPDLPRDRVRMLPEVYASYIRSWRIGTSLFAAAAGLALLLAAIGLYSVIAFGVRQREHEFGIRRALGADTGHLMRLVLTQGFALAVAGVVLGTALAAWGGKFIKPLLFQGREPHDPVAFGVAAVVLLLAALAASLIPAVAAAKVDPRQALQAE